jgi:MoaA/NifB/PqqE/SkfB family radical SAM enzyme
VCSSDLKKNKVVTEETKDKQFWINLMEHAKKLTDQIACGANGEPFMDVQFIKDLAAEAKKQGLLFNVTSNGRLLMLMADGELRDALKDITLISLSYDDFKVQTQADQDNYLNLVKKIHAITGCEVGANLLISQKMFDNHGKGLLEIVDLLFKGGIDRVFCLGLKNMPLPDILRFKHLYMLLTAKYENFYVDDCSRMVIKENSYTDWKHSCHYGKEMVSIDENGIITGCSFDCSKDSLLKLDKPSDLLNITKVKICERHNCPYLIKPKGAK